MKPEQLIEFTEEQQAAIGADGRAVELHPHAAIKLQPSVLGLAFTRKVRHSPPASDAFNALEYK
jgi:hypothetical protein